MHNPFRTAIASNTVSLWLTSKLRTLITTSAITQAHFAAILQCTVSKAGRHFAAGPTHKERIILRSLLYYDVGLVIVGHHRFHVCTEAFVLIACNRFSKKRGKKQVNGARVAAKTWIIRVLIRRYFLYSLPRQFIEQ